MGRKKSSAKKNRKNKFRGNRKKKLHNPFKKLKQGVIKGFKTVKAVLTSKKAKKVGRVIKQGLIEGTQAALHNPKIRKVISSSVGALKETIGASIEAECPECKAIGKFALKLPIVKKLMKSGRAKLAAKCPTCGEALDLVIES